jgi:hypothetical protein
MLNCTEAIYAPVGVAVCVAVVGVITRHTGRPTATTVATPGGLAINAAVVFVHTGFAGLPALTAES